MGVITGLERITYGVDDLKECERFFNDWGLRQLDKQDDRLLFETLELSQIEIKHMDEPGLPPAIEAGPTIRQVIWGVNAQSALDELVDKIGNVLEIEKDSNGIFWCDDPIGLRLGFQLSQRRPARILGSSTNCYGKISRVNQSSKLYKDARPVRLSHFVLFTDDIERHTEFYQNVLGFHLSDSYPGEGAFLRCQEEGGHHDIFLLKNLDVKRRGLNHVSFMVRDIYEMFGGGINMNRLGWETQIGPGRHPVSSAMFWYMKCPAGALVEYYADEDYVTKGWAPREFKKTTENFAEWAIIGGIDSETRKQKSQ